MRILTGPIDHSALLQEKVAAQKLLQCDALLIAAPGVGSLLGGARPAPRLLLRGLRQCTLLMTGVYLLSPLLQARKGATNCCERLQTSRAMRRHWLVPRGKVFCRIL